MGQGYSIDIKKKTCVTPECRGSYVSLLEARPLPQSTNTAWGMQCVFKKTPTVEKWVKELMNIYGQVLLDKFGKEKAGKIAQVLVAKKSFPIRDGDDPGTTGALANADQLKGCYFLNSNNRFKQPHIIGPAGKAVDANQLTTDDLYSGAYYRAMLSFWYYDTAGNKGISTSLEAVMKTKDGENLGAGTSKSEASNAFSDYSEEAASLFNSGDEPLDMSEELEKKEEDVPFDFM